MPRTLKEIGDKAFFGCKRLKVVYVEDGCEVSLCNTNVRDFAKVSLLPETMIGDVNVWDFRKLRDLVIPDGVERIGN